MKKILITFCFIVLASFTHSLKAQPPDPGGGGTPSCFPAPCVPIDGGISLLLLAGAAYGGKKAFDINKDKQQSIV